MATLDAAAIELAQSLSVEAVPAKLRCGSCNKLAINAVKLPCCDQSICEPCSQDLPESCPICGHSPLSAEDCKPNKSLRMTVKAFIKSEEKKRSKDTETPMPQTIATPVVAASETAAIAPEQSEDVAAVMQSEVAQDPASMHEPNQTEALPGQAVLSVETPAETQEEVNNLAEGHPIDTNVDEEDHEDDDDDDDDVIITTERPEEEAAPAIHNQEQQQQQGENENHQGNMGSMEQMQMNNANQNFGFNPNQQDFGNMDFNPMNFNPMMGMPNGMGMGNFPMPMPNMLGMPGMPGMNMDPSMMFGNGGNDMGFGGMSMNDMNMMGMAMGMGGMGGFGGGNGGMGGGGLNGPQPGFFPPGQGGYNHQNFGSQMNQSFPSNRGYGRPYGRGGYGRGRGGYRGGRGGWQNFPNQHHQGPHQYMNQYNAQQGQGFAGQAENTGHGPQVAGPRGSPSYEPMQSADGSLNDSNVVLRHSGGDDTADLAENAATDNTGEDTSTAADGRDDKDRIEESDGGHQNGNGPSVDGVENEQTTPQHFDQQMDTRGPGQNTAYGELNYTGQQQPSFNPGFRGRGGFNGNRGGGFHGSSAYGYVATVGGAEPSPPPAPPINAPTGPKAMRAGLPNSGLYSRPQPPASSITPQIQPDPESRRESIAGTEAAKLSERDERERTSSPQRSSSRHRSRRHRDRADDGYESERTYERRKERERRKRHDRERKYADEDERANGNNKGHSNSDSQDDRHGQERNSGEHRSSRSHHDRSRDRRRRRDRSRSPDRDGGEAKSHDETSRHKSRSERHRHRSRDRDGDRHRSHRDSSREEKYRSRNSSGRDRDRSHRKTELEQPEDDIGFKIKGGSRKPAAAMAPPTGPKPRDRKPSGTAELSSTVVAADPPLDSYAAERQAREQARLARHRSQLAQTDHRSTSLGKRDEREDDGLDVPTGPKGFADGGRRGKKARPMSYKYEDEIREGHGDGERKRWR